MASHLARCSDRGSTERHARHSGLGVSHGGAVAVSGGVCRRWVEATVSDGKGLSSRSLQFGTVASGGPCRRSSANRIIPSTLRSYPFVSTVLLVLHFSFGNILHLIAPGIACGEVTGDEAIPGLQLTVEEMDGLLRAKLAGVVELDARRPFNLGLQSQGLHRWLRRRRKGSFGTLVIDFCSATGGGPVVGCGRGLIKLVLGGSSRLSRPLDGFPLPTSLLRKALRRRSPLLRAMAISPPGRLIGGCSCAWCPGTYKPSARTLDRLGSCL